MITPCRLFLWSPQLQSLWVLPHLWPFLLSLLCWHLFLSLKRMVVPNVLSLTCFPFFKLCLENVILFPHFNYLTFNFTCLTPIFCSELKLLPHQSLKFSISKIDQYLFLKSCSFSGSTYLRQGLHHTWDHLSKKARSHLPLCSFLKSLLSNTTTACWLLLC